MQRLYFNICKAYTMSRRRKLSAGVGPVRRPSKAIVQTPGYPSSILLFTSNRVEEGKIGRAHGAYWQTGYEDNLLASVNSTRR